MSLQDLPVEAIVRIFLLLDYEDLLSASYLNHFFRDVYAKFPELQYSFTLQVYGMTGSNPVPGIRNKLEELERRERAWRVVDLSRMASVKVPHRMSHIYDLSGGVYLLGDCKNSISPLRTHTLRFFNLSTCTSGLELRDEPWPEISIDANIVDFGLALNEFDLIAVVGTRSGQNGESREIILSLRELSTGAPHPLTRHPDIVVDLVNDDRGGFTIVLEIVGPRLLLLIKFPRQKQNKLLLFNWWEGTKIVAELAPWSTWGGFVFLSPELVFLSDKDRGLEIIRLPDVTKGYSPKRFERVLRLSLPALQHSVKISEILCRAEPNPFGTPHPRMLGDKPETEFARRMCAKKRSPFASDPMKAVVLLQVDLQIDFYRGMPVDNLSLIVHRQFLLQLTDEFANKPPSSLCSAPKGEIDASARVDLPIAGICKENVSVNVALDTDAEISVPTIPWSQWGSHARWITDDTHDSDWITITAGQRYVCANDEGHIVVKDFNPIAVRRARAAPATAVNANNAHVLEGYKGIESVTLRRLFSEECQRPLPCVEYISHDSYDYDGLLIDEERIIGLRCDPDTDKIVEFSVYTL